MSTTEVTVIPVGTSLYIGIDLLYPNQDVRFKDIVDNLAKLRNVIESALTSYNEIYRVSMILSYLNSNKVESCVNTLYFEEGISNNQYDELIDFIMNTAESLVLEANKNVCIFSNVCYLLIEIKVSDYVDIDLAVFEPVKDGSEYLNIAIGPDLLSYIDNRVSTLENGFDFMNISYIRFDTDNIIADKVEYKKEHKDYYRMVIDGYFKFQLNHNGNKPDIMVVSRAYT